MITQAPGFNQAPTIQQCLTFAPAPSLQGCAYNAPFLFNLTYFTTVRDEVNGGVVNVGEVDFAEVSLNSRNVDINDTARIQADSPAAALAQLSRTLIVDCFSGSGIVSFGGAGIYEAIYGSAVVNQHVQLQLTIANGGTLYNEVLDILNGPDNQSFVSPPASYPITTGETMIIDFVYLSQADNPMFVPDDLISAIGATITIA